MRPHFFNRQTALGIAFTALLLVIGSSGALAAIQGITGPNFQLTAKTGSISTSDGESFLMWGYADTSAGGYQKMQYPGPTLIVNQGDVVTVTLTNGLPAEAGNTSIVFPGQVVTTSGGVPGVLTQEAVTGGSVTYQFTATHPGTFLYRSGSQPDLQVEMGLVGAIVVYPSMGRSYAYNHEDARFDREFVLVITEMDPTIHRMVEYEEFNLIDTSAYYPTNWFANGRNFPDNLSDDFVPWLPHQPYKFNPRLHPGERVLVRSVSVGNQLHPFHYHGNDIEVIGEGGRLLSSGPGMGADLAWQAATRRTIPGQTADVMWTWNAEQLGWDIYDHQPGVDYPRAEIDTTWTGNICDNFDPLLYEPNTTTQLPAPGDPDYADLFDPFTNEYCPDHGTLFPVILPTRDSLSFGPYYAGTPFLGGEGELAPGDPGLNATAGYFYMWHSHTEKELTSNDIWPGGLVTFAIVEHPAVPLP